MNISFTAKTIPDCVDYFKIKYMEKVYSLEQFSEEYKKKEFDLDILLPKCSFIYKNQEYTYKEYCDRQNKICEELKFFERCHNEILPMEPALQICNYEYYQAEKFLEKAEDCLQTARYYLQQSCDLFEYDCNVNWKTGYGPIFSIRCMNFKSAIVWYNNCFDYILQIPFLAFKIYKSVRGYNSNMDFETILKMCTFKVFRNLHDTHEHDSNISRLWEILSNCRDAISDITKWANYSKHKGGIGFIGLKAESPFQIFIGEPGKLEKRTSEFECIKLELDESIQKAIDTHKALYNCLDELVDFIDFGKAHHSIDEQGRMVIPDKQTYVKIIL